jgi:nucleoside-diphosphate-sugar epimerase
LKTKKEILVVGGTGFLGYHLSKKCLKLGWKVTSLSTKKPKKKRFLKNVNYIFCDISKKNSLKKISKKNFTFVVNFGGYVDHSNAKKTFNSHFIGVVNLSNFFLKKNLQAFIQIGSGGEYGNKASPHTEDNLSKKAPKSNYYKAKFLATNYLLSLFKEKNFPATILRLYQAYGPKQDLNRFIPIIIDGCIRNKEFPCSEGNQFRDFIYVDDVVDAIIKSLKSNNTKGEILNIGTGKPKKIKNIINSIKNKIKKGRPLFGKILLRKDEKMKFYPNINKSKKIINWYPKVNFQTGLENTINSFIKI